MVNNRRKTSVELLLEKRQKYLFLAELCPWQLLEEEHFLSGKIRFWEAFNLENIEQRYYQIWKHPTFFFNVEAASDQTTFCPCSETFNIDLWIGP